MYVYINSMFPVVNRPGTNLNGGSMAIMAIDPGTNNSGFVYLNGKDIIDKGILTNAMMIIKIKETCCHTIVCEMVECYGVAVGTSIFETCLWIGRFAQVASNRNIPFKKIYRQKDQPEKHLFSVQSYICNHKRINDAVVRQAIINMYPPDGDGCIPQIGTKKHPGPLYGITTHMWSALAVGLTYQGSIHEI